MAAAEPEPEPEQMMRLHQDDVVNLETLKKKLQEDGFKRCINEKLMWCHGPMPGTALWYTAMMGRAACVSYLLSQGAQVDAVDEEGCTALYWAVVAGHLDVVRVLLEGGADPDGSLFRITPLYLAAQGGRLDIMQELIRFGVDVDLDVDPKLLQCDRWAMQGVLKASPLYISAVSGHLEVFSLLLRSAGLLSRPTASCLLHSVLLGGCSAAFVRLLLEHGADPDRISWEGWGHAVLQKMDPEAVKVFLEARRCPRSLENACRVRIRELLGRHRLDQVHSLPLPQLIQDFLLHKN